MKKLLIVIFILLTTTSYAGQKAITDTGEEVILYSNGTWEYSKDAQKLSDMIEINKKIFNKPIDSSFLVKSTRNNSAFWINTNKWSFSKSEELPDAEYQFELKDKDLYGLAITEGIEIPLESLAKIALHNARSVAPDMEIVEQEYRIVNGNKVLYMQMNGTMEGVKFTYVGYYYSDDSGSTQLVNYTATNLVERYKPEINDFLNGLVKQ